jgi:hypothetical protein
VNALKGRLLGLALFLPSLGVLVTARNLSPDPTGMGTHQQLGLGGCGILLTTGIPCPMCGMTTTFSHLAHFELVDGFCNQPFGLFLFLLTVVFLCVGAAEFLHPKQRPMRIWKKLQRWELLWACFLLGGMLLGWLYKIWLVKVYLA